MWVRMDASVASFDQRLGLRVALPDQLLLVRVRECLLCAAILFVGFLGSPGTHGNQCLCQDSFKSDAAERYAGGVETEEVSMHSLSQQRSCIFRYSDRAPPGA